jgi:hypothetical protein
MEMRPSTRIALTLAFSLAGAALVGVAAASEKNAEGSVTIKFPKEETARVDLKCGKVDFRSVKLEGAPSRHEVHKARHHEHDTSKLRWIFKLGNEGKHTRKVTIKVKVYALGKELLAEDSRTDTISGEKDKDHISVWTEIKTRDYPKADHVRISADCERE